MKTKSNGFSDSKNEYMKAHFINFFKYENFVKMLVFIKVNESSLVSRM